MELVETPGFFGRDAEIGETPEEEGILQSAKKGPWLILAVKEKGKLYHVSQRDFRCLLVPVLSSHGAQLQPSGVKCCSPACSLSRAKDTLVTHLWCSQRQPLLVVLCFWMRVCDTSQGRSCWLLFWLLLWKKMQATFWRDGNWKEKWKEVSVNKAVFLEHGAFLILVCCASSRCCHSAGLGKQWVQVLLFPDTFRSGSSPNQYVPCSGAVHSSKALGLCQVCLRARPLEGYQALIALCACQCFFVSDRPVLCPSSLYGWHTINPWLLTDGLKIFKKTERLLALYFLLTSFLVQPLADSDLRGGKQWGV